VIGPHNISPVLRVEFKRGDQPKGETSKKSMGEEQREEAVVCSRLTGD
jgi:hypothetical protein